MFARKSYNMILIYGIYGGLEPYVTPYCLPATHIALTGGKEIIT